MAKKKILHVTQSTGGVGTYVSHIVNYSQPELFEFVMVAPADKRFERFCTERNIPFYEVDLHRNINPLSNLKALYKIIKIIKTERPDVIHAHSARGGFLGRAAAKYSNKRLCTRPMLSHTFLLPA